MLKWATCGQLEYYYYSIISDVSDVSDVHQPMGIVSTIALDGIRWETSEMIL